MIFIMNEMTLVDPAILPKFYTLITYEDDDNSIR